MAEMMTAGSVTAAATSATHKPNMKGTDFMPKQSDFDRAIENLNHRIAMLTEARDVIIAMKNAGKKPAAVRKPRIVKPEDKSA